MNVVNPVVQVGSSPDVAIESATGLPESNGPAPMLDVSEDGCVEHTPSRDDLFRELALERVRDRGNTGSVNVWRDDDVNVLWHHHVGVNLELESAPASLQMAEEVIFDSIVVE